MLFCWVFLTQALQVKGADDASLFEEFGGVFSAETAHHDNRQARSVRHRPAGRGEEADRRKNGWWFGWSRMHGDPPCKA